MNAFLEQCASFSSHLFNLVLGPLSEYSHEFFLTDLTVVILVDFFENIPDFFLRVLSILEESGDFVIGDHA